MAGLTERQNQILNMPPIVFRGYTSMLTEEKYQTEYLKTQATVPTDKRNHATVTKNTVLNIISCNHDKDDYSLKLRVLAHIFNQPAYFQELVEVGIPKEQIAQTFNTTVENVECQIILNEKAKEFQATAKKPYIKK